PDILLFYHLLNVYLGWLGPRPSGAVTFRDPPDFTIESIAFIGKSVSELPLAVLTTNCALVPISYYFTTC
ncbi:MAG TPA: hypothetical protein PL191_00995, partial [Candidatus Saccharimonas sp.]|nr:hypothetical protein [Candidatus Saccharimonas sp.]